MSEAIAPLAPLAGIRVLELGNYIAAPTAGRLLGDFGAEVIKIERPVTGDELRNWRLNGGDTSMLFRTINRNKKSVVLDLRSGEGRSAILQLVRHCDVVLENFRPGTLEKWGLGPEQLNAANPTSSSAGYRRSVRPARNPVNPVSRRSPKPSAVYANWSVTPTGHRSELVSR